MDSSKLTCSPVAEVLLLPLLSLLLSSAPCLLPCLVFPLAVLCARCTLSSSVVLCAHPFHLPSLPCSSLPFDSFPSLLVLQEEYRSVGPFLCGKKFSTHKLCVGKKNSSHTFFGFPTVFLPSLRLASLLFTSLPARRRIVPVGGHFLVRGQFFPRTSFLASLPSLPIPLTNISLRRARIYQQLFSTRQTHHLRSMA